MPCGPPLKGGGTPFGPWLQDKGMNYESEEARFESLEKMLISVDKKISNEVCKHWGIIDARTVLLIRQSYEENIIKYIMPKDIGKH